MIELLISAFVLGLVGGIIPGPILAATFTEILQSSLSKSFRIIFWGMLTETIAALITLIALSSLNLSESVFRTISFIGAFILVYIAIGIWKVNRIDTGARVHFSLRQISAMILANGELWIFWATVCVPKAILLDTYVPFGKYVFLIIVEVGWLISTVGTAIVFSGFRNLFSHPRAIEVMFKVFACAFVYFAFRMAYDSTMFFMAK